MMEDDKKRIVCLRSSQKVLAAIFLASLFGPLQLLGGVCTNEAGAIGGAKLLRPCWFGGVFVTLELGAGQSAARNSPSKAVFCVCFLGVFVLPNQAPSCPPDDSAAVWEQFRLSEEMGVIRPSCVQGLVPEAES